MEQLEKCRIKYQELTKNKLTKPRQRRNAMGKHPFPPAADFSAVALYIIPFAGTYSMTVPTEASSSYNQKSTISERIFWNPAYTYAGAEHLEWDWLSGLQHSSGTKMDEVKDEIYNCSIYARETIWIPTSSCVLSSRMLKCNSTSKRIEQSGVHNNALIEQSLEECKTNL